MELDALKKTGKDNERLIENLLAEKEDSIRQITELRQEINGFDRTLKPVIAIDYSPVVNDLIMN